MNGDILSIYYIFVGIKNGTPNAMPGYVKMEEMDNPLAQYKDKPKWTFSMPRFHIIALFLKKVISKCLSNDFLHHDLQFVMLIMILIDSVTFMYFLFLYQIIFVCSIMFRSYEH